MPANTLEFGANRAAHFGLNGLSFVPDGLVAYINGAIDISFAANVAYISNVGAVHPVGVYCLHYAGLMATISGNHSKIEIEQELCGEEGLIEFHHDIYR